MPDIKTPSELTNEYIQRKSDDLALSWDIEEINPEKLKKAKLSNFLGCFFVDPTVTDQGIATTETNRSLYDIINLIGGTKNAIICFQHTKQNNTTDYAISTNVTVPSNIKLVFEYGAVIDGSATLTINGPISSLSSNFGGTITKTLNYTNIDLLSEQYITNLLSNIYDLNINNSLADATASGIKINKTVNTNAFGQFALMGVNSSGTLDVANASGSLFICRYLILESGTGLKLALTQGYVRNDSWTWTPGAQLFLSETDGTITETAPSTSGSKVQVIGFAETATIIYFNPDGSYLTIA